MYLFASEAVSAGHPDKCADIIADSIVDTLLQLDPDSNVATEVFITLARPLPVLLWPQPTMAPGLLFPGRVHRQTSQARP